MQHWRLRNRVGASSQELPCRSQPQREMMRAVQKRLIVAVPVELSTPSEVIASVVAIDGVAIKEKVAETAAELRALPLVVQGAVQKVPERAARQLGALVVQGAVQRCKQLEDKKAFRDSAAISGLQTAGSSKLKSKVPKRVEYGEAGDAGDAAHAAAMEEFSVKEFGSSHVQDRTLQKRKKNVGLFGDWLEQNNYGPFVKWELTADGEATNKCMLAVERDGKPRVPTQAAMMEYVLAMATGDVESRPKGGRPEYRNGVQEEPALNGKRLGQVMSEENKKEFGWGAYADEPFRYRGVEQQVRAAGSSGAVWEE